MPECQLDINVLKQKESANPQYNRIPAAPAHRMSEEVRELLQPCKNLVGGIIHACHRLMTEFGYISDENQWLLADIFNLSKAEVSGIISFYHDFKTTPQPPRKIRICAAESCQANQVRQLIQDVQNHLGKTIPCHTSDDQIAIDFCYCLGLCPLGPAIEVDGNPIAYATSEQVIRYL